MASKLHVGSHNSGRNASRSRNPVDASSGLGSTYSYFKSSMGTSDGIHKNSRREMKDAGWSSYTIQRLPPTAKSSEWPPLQMDIMINGCLIFRPEAFPCKDYVSNLIPTEFTRKNHNHIERLFFYYHNLLNNQLNFSILILPNFKLNNIIGKCMNITSIMNTERRWINRRMLEEKRNRVYHKYWTSRAKFRK